MSYSDETTTNLPRLLQQIDGGVPNSVLSVAMSQVAAAVRAHQKTGEVTIKFKLKDAGSSDGSYLDLTTDINITEPKETGKKSESFSYKSIAFVSFGGKLTYERPSENFHGQKAMELVGGNDNLQGNVAHAE